MANYEHGSVHSAQAAPVQPRGAPEHAPEKRNTTPEQSSCIEVLHQGGLSQAPVELEFEFPTPAAARPSTP